jgi:hypothetical protein
MAKFPHGKLTPDDEGELALAMGIQDDVCIIAFAEPTTWIGLPLDELHLFIARLTAIELQLEARQLPS